MTLIDRLGGERAVESVVSALSERILADPELSPYFDSHDYDVIVEHRTAYLIAILGGPEQYSGASMRQAHQHLKLTHAHMDLFLTLLEEVLVDAGISPLDIAHVRKEVDRLRPAIVAAPGRRARPSAS